MEICQMCGDDIHVDEPTVMDWVEGRVHLTCAAEEQEAIDFEAHWWDDK